MISVIIKMGVGIHTKQWLHHGFIVETVAVIHEALLIGHGHFVIFGYEGNSTFSGNNIHSAANYLTLGANFYQQKQKVAWKQKIWSEKQINFSSSASVQFKSKRQAMHASFESSV